MEQCHGNAWCRSSTTISLHEQTMGSTWVKCQKVRGQGSFDAWVDGDDSLRAVCREEAGGNRETVKCSERGRRAMFTVLPSKSPCVNCNMYVGWCNLRPSRHASQGFAWSGGWHRDVKSEDVMGRRAPHGGVAMGWTKKHCERWVFSVCCQASNYNFFNPVLTICVGVVKLESVCFDLNRCDVTDVENWKPMKWSWDDIWVWLQNSCYS